MRQMTEDIASQGMEPHISIKVVSQVSFTVSGDDIFQTLLQRVLKWARRKPNVHIPNNAWNGETF